MFDNGATGVFVKVAFEPHWDNLPPAARPQEQPALDTYPLRSQRMRRMSADTPTTPAIFILFCFGRRPAVRSCSSPRRAASFSVENSAFHSLTRRRTAIVSRRVVQERAS